MSDVKSLPYTLSIKIKENKNIEPFLREGDNKRVSVKSDFESWSEAVFVLIDALRASGYHIPNFDTDESRDEFMSKLTDQYFRY